MKKMEYMKIFGSDEENGLREDIGIDFKKWSRALESKPVIELIYRDQG